MALTRTRTFGRNSRRISSTTPQIHLRTTLPMMGGLVFNVFEDRIPIRGTDAESRIPALPGKHLSFVSKDRGLSFFS